VLRHRLRRYNSEIVPKETETVETSGCNPSTMKVITGSPWMSISFDTTGPGYRDLGIVQIVKSQTVLFWRGGMHIGWAARRLLVPHADAVVACHCR